MPFPLPISAGFPPLRDPATGSNRQRPSPCEDHTPAAAATTAEEEDQRWGGKGGIRGRTGRVKSPLSSATTTDRRRASELCYQCFFAGIFCTATHPSAGGPRLRPLPPEAPQRRRWRRRRRRRQRTWSLRSRRR